MRIRNSFFLALIATMMIWTRWDDPHRWWWVGIILVFIVGLYGIDRFRRHTR